MNLFQILSLLLCTCIINSLHLTHQLNHAYLSQLKDQQHNVGSKIDELQLNIDETTDKVRNANNVD